MRERLRGWADTIDSLGLRERIFALLSVLGLLFLLMDTSFYQPALKEQRRANDAIDNLQRQLAVLERESADLMTSDVAGLRQRREHHISELQALDASLDRAIRERVGLVVDSSQIARMLRDILAEDRELTLLELSTNLSESSSKPELKAAGPKASPIDPLGRYQLTLRLEGSYLATLRFLQRLEKLPWALFSEELDFEVQKYPSAQVTLRLFALGGAVG